MAKEIYIKKVEIVNGVEKETLVKLSDIQQEFFNVLGWCTPAVSLNDGSIIGVGIYINDDNTGKYYSFDSANDDLISFDIALENNGVAYDGSDLAIELEGRLDSNGATSDTVGWLVDYHFIKEGDNSSTGSTSIAQNNIDVSAELQDIEFKTTLGTMDGVTGATSLLLTLTRNSTGAGADTFPGNWEGLRIKLNKIVQ